MFVTKDQRTIWEENSKNGQVKETDDFETTIRIGEYPVETCQYWGSSGRYVQSILSNFDTNKKIIVHENKSGKIDARAILRLTKMTKDDNALYYGEESKPKNEKSFGFKDIIRKMLQLIIS